MKVRHEGRETPCRCVWQGEANGRKPPWGKPRGGRSGAEHPANLGVACLPAWIRRGAIVTRSGAKRVVRDDYTLISLAPGVAPAGSDVDLLVDVEEGPKLLDQVGCQLSGKGL